MRKVVLPRHNQARERVAAFQRLKASLEMGAAQAERGELLDPEIVFEELREMIQGAPTREVR